MMEQQDDHCEQTHPLPETDTPIRPYAHLIDDQADRSLFEQVCFDQQNNSLVE